MRPGGTPEDERLSCTMKSRQLFWENVLRDMLTGLSVQMGSHPELFDGRIAVLTHSGERIPIARVFPMFACSVPGIGQGLSTAVQCTVFQIFTPSGEVFTLPLQEIRGLHTFTPELLRKMQEGANRLGPGDEDRPFGFAAFRQLAEEEEQARKDREDPYYPDPEAPSGPEDG